jgi:hypothetical protein
MRLLWVAAHRLTRRAWRGVGVLVFVDQDVLEAVSVGAVDVGVLAEELEPAQQQVVVVHHAHGLLAAGVGVEGGEDGVSEGEEGGGSASQRAVDADAGVQGQGQDAKQRLGGGFLDAPLGCVRGSGEERGALGHEVGGVGGVEDVERGGEADKGGVLSQNPQADVVEGAAPEGVGAAADEGDDPRQQLVGGLVRERQQQHPLGRDAEGQQVGDAASQGAGLAAASACDDERGAARGARDGALGVVEVGEEVLVRR